MTVLFVANDNDIVLSGLQRASDLQFVNDAVMAFTLGDETTEKVITGASNATPIVITSVAHGLVTNDRVVIVGVVGNEAANGTHTVTVLTADTFQLNGSVGSGVYVQGGVFYRVVTGGDEVSMTYEGGNGNYRGVLSGTVSLVPDRRYWLVVTASNYNLRWEIRYYARTRR